MGLFQFLSFIFYFNNVLWSVVLSQTPQPNVISDGKSFGLFLWIYLNPGYDIRPAVKLASNLHTIVKDLQTKSGNSDNEILAGIGFGTTLYSQVKNSTNRVYRLANRKGILGSLPYTGGDLFIHAKCNNLGLLFELSQIVKEQLLFSAGPDLQTGFFGFEDTYGFVYRNGRDLSGFIDGTENPVSKERSAIAVDANGGSYCITQKWIHDLDFIHQQSVAFLEGVIGRRMNDSKELDPKPASSHVARMTSGPQLKADKPVQMYRQSMPYGNLGSKAGLFFIGFANDPNNFDYFLNRMISTNYNNSDDVMRISKCQSGNYWYFPSMEELQNLAILAPHPGPSNNNTAGGNGTNLSGQNQGRFLFQPNLEDEMARNLDTGQNCQTSFNKNSGRGRIEANRELLLFFIKINFSVFVFLLKSFYF